MKRGLIWRATDRGRAEPARERCGGGGGGQNEAALERAREEREKRKGERERVGGVGERGGGRGRDRARGTHECDTLTHTKARTHKGQTPFFSWFGFRRPSSNGGRTQVGEAPQPRGQAGGRLCLHHRWPRRHAPPRAPTAPGGRTSLQKEAPGGGPGRAERRLCAGPCACVET